MVSLPPQRLIVGLGNPGPNYALTRHNIGFRGIDALSAHFRIALAHRRSGAVFGIGAACGLVVAMVKPMTYMNRSGVPTGALLTHWGLTCREILVIHDDMDLAFGRIKIKKKGGDGGHRGIRSLIDVCRDDRFPGFAWASGVPNQMAMPSTTCWARSAAKRPPPWTVSSKRYGMPPLPSSVRAQTRR
jgi:PTH1 family peptidyl-tRNA hydrolase